MSLPEHFTRRHQAQRTMIRAILDLDKGNGVTAVDLAGHFGRSDDEGFRSKLQRRLASNWELVSEDGEHFSLAADSPTLDEFVGEETFDALEEEWDCMQAEWHEEWLRDRAAGVTEDD